MKLSELKSILPNLESLRFKLLDGPYVPAHFHVTEVGRVTKDFIDCGGTVRSETVVNFQLWQADDYDHRLAPQKFFHILRLSEKILGESDLPIEVEYQQNTIGKFGLDFDGTDFILTPRFTACLAQDACGIPPKPSQAGCTQPGCC